VRVGGGVSGGCLGVHLSFCVGGEVDVCGCSVIGMVGVLDGWMDGIGERGLGLGFLLCVFYCVGYTIVCAAIGGGL
jgi:hypothetical protein